MAAAVEQNGMEKISDEIVLHILQFLPLDDVLSVQRVSRRFSRICQDKTLWRHTELRSCYGLSDDLLKDIISHQAENIQHLSLHGCYWLHSIAIEVLSRCVNLRTLNLSHCRVTTKCLSKILSATKELRHLAWDVEGGFRPSFLSQECKETLKKLKVLKQVYPFEVHQDLFGVLTFCPALERIYLLGNVQLSNVACWTYNPLEEDQAAVSVRNLKELVCYGFENSEVASSVFNLLTGSIKQGDPHPTLHSYCISGGPFVTYEKAVGSYAQAFEPFKTDLLQLDLSSGREGICSISDLEKTKNLQFLRLSYNYCLHSYDLMTVSTVCQNLRVLNLMGCRYCFSCSERFDWDLSGLEAVAENCPHLHSLNLSGAHHCNSFGCPNVFPSDGLADTIAKMKGLVSLSLPACSVGTSKKSKKSRMDPMFQGNGPRPQTSSRTSHYSKADPQILNLWKIVQGCPLVEEFELLGVGFHSQLVHKALHLKSERDKGGFFVYRPCDDVKSRIKDADLSCICEWQKLRKLTLGALPGVVTGEFLQALPKRCPALRHLSLANLGPTGQCIYSKNLLAALRRMPHLQDFRFEQPNFNVVWSFLEALYNCVDLQRLCVVARNGEIDPHLTLKLFEKCKHLVVCQLFTMGQVLASHRLQQLIRQRYQSERPALHVAILHLLMEDSRSLSQLIPMVHLEEFTMYKSRVGEQPL
ncbi:FBXL18 [Branchiostoma lanceolatum]|uniref:FBXL18 protein n=1 Tax=Branchiostoma lanceolatum TaxID=7740 RepID=A0A8J9ZHG9_BRALA|nr:FBXL18 [Branchiostoma lanceolatum]